MPQREAPAPLRILLVEDNEHDALAFRRAFQKAALAPCDIARCERAEEALTKLCAQTASFDLVVADYKLPGMSGLELYRALRASNIPIPLVLLTGAGAEYLAVEALKAGVDDYIVKDVSQSYLDLLPLVLSEVVQRYRDRLDHRRAQEVVREHEHQLRLVTDALPVGISYIDVEQCYRFNNRTYETWFGQLHGALYGKRLQQVMGEEGYIAVRAHIEAALAGQARTFEHVISFPRTGRRDLHIMFIPDLDTQGHPRGYYELLTDITERKRLETDLHQAQKMQAIGTMAGGIAHEFNNILAAMLGYTELAMLDVPSTNPSHPHLHAVLMVGERAKDLVQQLLAFSRQTELEHTPMKLHLLVQKALGLIRRTLPTTLILRQDVDQDVGTVLTSLTEMHQILMNLCANAAHAMCEAGGMLDIRLDTMEVEEHLTSRPPLLQPGPYARLSVRDTGHGMTPDIVERIFEPFFTTKKVGEGTGMGLAVVHGIVTHHGGAIIVESTPGQGTTFVIYLPHVAEAAATVAALEKPVALGKGRVLYVDDDVSLAHLGQVLLTRLGYEVVVCTSGGAALDVFLETPYGFDLVITDQTMPHMTGRMLVRELRRIRPDIPIILCTGYSNVIDADKATAQGIEAFLMKPLSLDTLSHTIQRVLVRREEPPS